MKAITKTKKKAGIKYPAILETWTERERGWGNRPDGVSLHLNEKDYKKYVEKYWKNETAYNNSSLTPAEYSNQDNNTKIVFVSKRLFDELTKNKKKYGIRYWEGEFSKIKPEISFKIIN